MRFSKLGSMPNKDALIPVLLGRFIVAGQMMQQMKMHYSDQDDQLRLKSMSVFLPSFVNTKTGLAMSLWLGTLYVVVEGWQAAKLLDPEIDQLLASRNVRSEERRTGKQ